MNIKEIRELIQMIEESSAVEEFELERAGVRIRIRKTQSASEASSGNTTPAKPAPADLMTSCTGFNPKCAHFSAIFGSYQCGNANFETPENDN